MQEEYDFSNAKPGRLAGRGTTQITIRINNDTLEYFKQLSEEAILPYQTLINFYLNDCAKKKMNLGLSWDGNPGAGVAK
ncbi:MAG: BrnA antitoxin family protein [Clostridiales Family XIII bacterium]|jgi:predicted DNA binding CopG/RHH family protein|nr:BrnA antitoxin family protein [Clostridiales Family XIII bacterium]